jgi:hypothetical protein
MTMVLGYNRNINLIEAIMFVNAKRMIVANVNKISNSL